MSTGLRYKFQNSHISIMTAFGANSPADAITAITKTNPAVVTSAAHGRSNGDVVYITTVVGMTEVNSRAFIVSNKTTNTFELYGVDSTGYGTYTSGGTFTFGAWSEFCEVTQHNRTGASKTQIPATTVCSTEEEYEVGLSGQGTIALSFNYAPMTSLAQVALNTWDLSGDVMAMRLQLPKNGGTITRMGSVQQTSDTGGVNGLWTASATILLTGPAYRQAAA